MTRKTCWRLFKKSQTLQKHPAVAVLRLIDVRTPGDGEYMALGVPKKPP